LSDSLALTPGTSAAQSNKAKHCNWQYFEIFHDFLLFDMVWQISWGSGWSERNTNPLRAVDALPIPGVARLFGGGGWMIGGRRMKHPRAIATAHIAPWTAPGRLC